MKYYFCFRPVRNSQEIFDDMENLRLSVSFQYTCGIESYTYNAALAIVLIHFYMCTEIVAELESKANVYEKKIVHSTRLQQAKLNSSAVCYVLGGWSL
jgi:hypothetical protein